MQTAKRGRTTFLTDEDVEREIARLTVSPEVKLARRELALKYKRRQRLYSLRTLYRRGEELIEAGVTDENLETLIAAAEEDE